MLEKLAPLLKAVQKLIAKEFLWMMACILLALPVAVLLRYMSMIPFGDFSFYQSIVTEMEQVPIPDIDGEELNISSVQIAWMYFYLLGFAGIYLVRFTASSIKTMLTPKKKAA